MSLLSCTGDHQVGRECPLAVDDAFLLIPEEESGLNLGS